MMTTRLALALASALCLAAATTGAAGASALPDGTGVTIGGVTYKAQNSNRPWSLVAGDDGVLRFEVRPGDRWRNDPATRERSEISGPAHPDGTHVTIEVEFMIEPGSPNTARDMILGQFHADDPSTSPPFAVRLRGEKLRANVAWAGPGQQPTSKVIFRDDAPIERGRYYRLKIDVRFASDGTGFARIWRDGKQIADYSGPLGYGYGNYWKQGIYRPVAAETIAARYRNLTVTYREGGAEGASEPTVR